MPETALTPPTVAMVPSPANQGPDGRIPLSALSARDATWDEHKRFNRAVTGLYRDGGQVWQNYADRTADCSRFLTFRANFSTEKITLKLVGAKFCRVRFCPICMWRRSMKWQAIFHQTIPSIVREYPAHRWIFLTLTVRNCPVEELRETIGHMGRSFTRLTHREDWPGKGWVKSLEVKRAGDGLAHPHFHVLLLVNPSYFHSREYVSQARWSQLWQESLRADYQPIVDVRRVKGDAVDAIPEVIKYESKPTEFALESDGQDPWLLQLQPQMHKIRSVSVSGVLKPFLKLLEQEQDDLIGQDGDGVTPDSQELSFVWGTEKSSYVLHELESACGHSLSLGVDEDGRGSEPEPACYPGGGVCRNSAFSHVAEVPCPASASTR